MSKERINTNPHMRHFEMKRRRFFPNSKLPVLIYEEAISLPKQKNRACDIIRQIVWRNGWSNTWRNGIYDFHHYHSNTHECMIIAMGNAGVILGGGIRKIMLKQGDVMILPAGVAHRCIRFSKDFLCVGAYPQGRNYDMNYGTEEEYKSAAIRIPKLSLPANDPIYGKEGFLKMYWK